MPDLTLPDYAYVPGQTPRHDEAIFEVYHESVSAGLSLEDLKATLAWQAGLVFYDKGYFWEAHEVLEPVWMATPRNSAEHQLVQGIIQLANAALKARMKRPNAALRLCGKARDHIRAARSAGGDLVMEQSISTWMSEIDSIEALIQD